MSEFEEKCLKYLAEISEQLASINRRQIDTDDSFNVIRSQLRAIIDSVDKLAAR